MGFIVTNMTKPSRPRYRMECRLHVQMGKKTTDEFQIEAKDRAKLEGSDFYFCYLIVFFIVICMSEGDD